MSTVVVLPLVPVMVSHGRGADLGAHPPGQLDLAPDGDAGLRGRREQRLVGPPPRGGDDEVGRRTVRHTGHVLGAEAHVHAEDVEDAGPLAEGGVDLGVSAVDRDDARAALVQGVGRGEAADPEPGHDDADAAPVGAAAGQAVEPPAHAAPTTHSA